MGMHPLHHCQKYNFHSHQGLKHKKKSIKYVLNLCKLTCDFNTLPGERRLAWMHNWGQVVRNWRPRRPLRRCGRHGRNCPSGLRSATGMDTIRMYISRKIFPLRGFEVI